MGMFRIILFCTILSIYQVSQAQVPAFYLFGDSLIDPGNNKYLFTTAQAAFPPNGIDFQGGRATGRFCNGLTVVDLIVTEFGLPLTPPYHDPSTKGNVILKGVSFASGGARILNEAGNFLQNVEPLGKQIQNFVRTRSEIIELFNGQEEAALNHLSKSIFIFAMGSNDYINYMNSSKSKPPQEFKNQMLTAYQQYLHQVYTLGARKVMVFGLGPLGCVPSKRESHGKACHEETNTLALDFDSGLLQMVKDMNSQLPDLKMVYGTTYSLFYDLANNPERYGFFSSSSACCGLTPRKLFACLPGGSVCPRRNEYVYWDAYHPTEAANRLVAKAILDGDLNYMYPFNLRQLASI